MLDTLVDVPHVAVALGLASLAMVATVAALPTTPPPDAAAAGETIDAVAASPHPTVAAHPLTAAALRLGPETVALRNDGGTAHARLARGPVTPVGQSGPLDRVLDGVSPERVFGSPGEFAAALALARNRTPTWRPAGEELRVRNVAWEDVDATLVGA